MFVPVLKKVPTDERGLRSDELKNGGSVGLHVSVMMEKYSKRGQERNRANL